MTDEQMNAALVAEFQRLGGREGIDKVMAEMGVTGVAGLNAEQQQQLLTAVKAISNG